MNPKNEEQAPSYRTMLKKHLNSLSEEKCKDCCYVANLIPESEEDEFEEENESEDEEDEEPEEDEFEDEEDEFEEENESEDEFEKPE